MKYFLIAILFFSCFVCSYGQTEDSSKIRINDSLYFYFFNSTPYNAEVYKNDTLLLGLTPLRLYLPEKLEGDLIFKKTGYFSKRFSMDNYDSSGGVHIILKSYFAPEDDIVDKDKSTIFKKERNYWKIGALGLATLGSAYASITFKKKANDYYDRYTVSNDRSLLDKSREFDIYYGISIVLTQAAFIALIYFLFMD